VILVAMSLYIRLRMKESPIFSGLKAQGKTSTNPLKDALSGWENWKRILRTLFGATAGQGVVWNTGQFYALFYLTTILKLETEPARIVIAAGLLLGMPLFTFFGSLSDKIGRKRIMMTGCLLAAVFYLPIYHGMVSASGTGVVRLKSTLDPITKEPKLSALDDQGRVITVKTDKTHKELLAAGGVTPAKDPNYPLLVFYIFLQMIFVTMVYGPIAAYLVEAFPAKVRYTSLSLPYHIGNGVFGGMLPLIGLYVNSATKNIYAGLYYPIAIAALTFVVGSLTLKETRDVRIWDELEAMRQSEPVRA
jgi:MFS family permease